MKPPGPPEADMDDEDVEVVVVPGSELNDELVVVSSKLK